MKILMFGLIPLLSLTACGGSDSSTVNGLSNPETEIVPVEDDTSDTTNDSDSNATTSDDSSIIIDSAYNDQYLSESCDITYDSSDNPYRLANGGGWLGESDDGCTTDKFTTWPEWQCSTGELSRTIARFWAKDTIDADDPDFEFAGYETVVNSSDETLEMGIQMLSVDPVVISNVDFLVKYPANLLTFSHIERHWASIIRDEPPSNHINVEVLEPGLLQFTWSMDCLPRVIHKGDIPVASMYFDIIGAGEGYFEFPRSDDEVWNNYSPPYQWNLKSDVDTERPVWATMVDGTEGPVYFYWNNKLTVR